MNAVFWTKHTFCGDIELVLREDIIPHTLHVIPVVDNTVLHRVPQLQQTTVFLQGEENYFFVSIPVNPKFRLPNTHAHTHKQRESGAAMRMDG